MLDLYGKETGAEFLRKLAQQNPQARDGGTLTVTPVGAGELPIAFSVNANNVENIKVSGIPVDWVRIGDALYGEPHPAAFMARPLHPNVVRLLVGIAISKEGWQLMSNLGKVPGRGDVQPKISVDQSKLRILPSEEQAQTAYYQKLFDDLLTGANKTLAQVAS